MKQTHLALLLTSVLLAGCSLDGVPETPAQPAAPVGSPAAQNGAVVAYRYIPIEPLPVPVGLTMANGKPLVWTDNMDALGLFENEALNESIATTDASGNFEYLVAGANAAYGSGRMTLDSIRYTVVPYPVTQSGALSTPTVVFLIVGIGARADIDFSSAKGGVTAGQLLSLSAQNVTGNIMMRSMGISSSSISPMLRTPAGLTVENISETFRALDTIKLIGSLSASDSSVKITPEIIGIDPGDLSMNVVLADLYSFIHSANPSDAAKTKLMLLNHWRSGAQ
jgi:hypothetical protein